MTWVGVVNAVVYSVVAVLLFLMCATAVCVTVAALSGNRRRVSEDGGDEDD